MQELPSLVEDKSPAPSPVPLDLDETQRKIWDALAERRNVEELTEQLAVPITELARQLMTLELKRVVRRLPGNCYERF